MNSPSNGSAKATRDGPPISDALKVLKAAPRNRAKGQKLVRGGTNTKGAYVAGDNGIFVFRFADLEPTAGGRRKTGDHYANTHAVVIEGRKIMDGLARAK